MRRNFPFGYMEENVNGTELRLLSFNHQERCEGFSRLVYNPADQVTSAFKLGSELMCFNYFLKLFKLKKKITQSDIHSMSNNRQLLLL